MFPVIWLDIRQSGPDFPPDPFENEQKHPGVLTAARGEDLPAGYRYGTKLPVGSFYGYATGVLGLRLFPNPDFDQAAARNRAPLELHVPAVSQLAAGLARHLTGPDRHHQQPEDDERGVHARATADGGQAARPGDARRRARQPSVQRLRRAQSVDRVLQEAGHGVEPRVLKDGADSVGALGALNRVFVNIGEFGEEWLQHFNPLVGGSRPTPIPVAASRARSAYWQRTESQTPDLAFFFLTAAHRLKDAPGGATLERGKAVFADACARCHSSKLPALPPDVAAIGGCGGRKYLECRRKYSRRKKTDGFKNEMRKIVLAADVLDDNFLSTDLRVPLTVPETNACSPLASNAIRDIIWDNSSSESHKTLPPVGRITSYQPYTGGARELVAPDGGRGYTRAPSLVSLWSTAPFLLNNSVGRFEWQPSVEARLRSFDDSIKRCCGPRSGSATR